MVYIKTYLPLAEDEIRAIEKMSEKEMRSFRDQARFLLRSQLIAMGALAPDPTSNLATQLEAR